MLQTKTSKWILAMILAAAGIYGTALAADQPSPSVALDEITSEQIIRSLVPKNDADLDAILQAQSIEELTPEQQSALLQMVQQAAKRLQTTIKPIV